MLIIFQETGQIDQIVLTGETEKLKEIYEQNGHLAMESFEDHVNLAEVYVENPLDEARRKLSPRYYVGVEYDRTELKADGVDEILLTPVLPCRIGVVFNDATIAHGDLAGEPLQFSADEPGTYTLIFTPPFPYKPTIIYIEATA
jgi:hypothetical protein